jgi:ATP-dependent RNA helicase SUPV3L1/SUV3
VFDPEAGITASTIEIMNTERHYDVAVIDEAQMIADPFRGHNWTRALLGICADEIHVCMAPEAEEIVKAVIDECEDDYEVVYHERKTPLNFQKGSIALEEVQKGDALVVFSRRSVLSLASALARHHIRASVIYGDLPPASRREQVHKFASGETDVVVSTDAIGMGLNLAIRRIIFVEVKKFDGTDFRLLLPSEIKQVAGRAGRYGLSEAGYVMALEHPSHVANALDDPVDPIDIAYLGFPERLLTLDGELMYLMHEWKRAPTEKFYVKMDLSEIETMHEYLRENERETFAKLEKQELYELLTCAVNIKNDDMMAQWALYCRQFGRGDAQYSLPEQTFGTDLKELETEYHCLDLYYQISRKTRRTYDEEYLTNRKMVLEAMIDEQLMRYKNRTSRRCLRCGRYLPPDCTKLCPACKIRWKKG